MKGFGIYVKNDLLDPKHVHAMNGHVGSASIWLYLWILDKMTSIDSEKGIGKVLGGRPVQFKEIEKDLGISRRTYARWIILLRKGGYISTTKTMYGLIITVHKAKKIFGNRSKRDVPDKAQRTTRSGTTHLPDVAQLVTRSGTTNKTIQLDNTDKDNTSRKFEKKRKRRFIDERGIEF